MDEAIKKVKASMAKQMDKLVKMDVPRDKKLKKCSMMTRKTSRGR